MQLVSKEDIASAAIRKVSNREKLYIGDLKVLNLDRDLYVFSDIYAVVEVYDMEIQREHEVTVYNWDLK